MTTETRRNMSDLVVGRNGLRNRAISALSLAQSCASHCARPEEAYGLELGDPLSIREVARMLGCSPWTIRQQHMPRGLPHFRSGPNSKITFFRGQVVAWILNQQRKGG